MLFFLITYRREAALATGNMNDDITFQDLEDESPIGSRLRSTSTIESISKRRLPFPEYLSVVANSTNALLGVSIFATPWGYAKSGLLGKLPPQYFCYVKIQAVCATIK